MYEEGVKVLVEAVVMQAVHDYKKAKRRLEKHPDDPQAQYTVNETTAFFKSSWFEMMTGFSGTIILRRLQNESNNVGRYIHREYS